MNGLISQLMTRVKVDRFDGFARLDHLGKIDLHHDGIHHEKQADGDGNRHHRRAVRGDGQTVQVVRGLGREFSQNDARTDAQQHPGGQVFLEDAQPLGLFGDAGFVHQFLISLAGG